ncbi:unnamed protein product [Protopolystoma xenopodis]|uniref:Uncharacterized protein n=1 Tax=Protopolystoma xenopodis TaxID=117903 RepID=A0A448WM89_9PLAT|nr:unnamed protein product [Protopolystoma xenopodis]
MARLSDDADYEAGEMCGNVPRPRSDFVNDVTYNGLRTRGRGSPERLGAQFRNHWVKGSASRVSDDLYCGAKDGKAHGQAGETSGNHSFFIFQLGTISSLHELRTCLRHLVKTASLIRSHRIARGGLELESIEMNIQFSDPESKLGLIDLIPKEVGIGPLRC